jgi:hypothetical protein
MSFSYATLGDNCKSQTVALTSNAKYILPLSEVYYKRFTSMMYYPGHESAYGADANRIFGHTPESIKAYNSKESSPHLHSHDPSVQQGQKKCPSCTTWN